MSSNCSEIGWFMLLFPNRSQWPLRGQTSSWRPFGPLDFVLRALRALRHMILDSDTGMNDAYIHDL